MRRALVFLFLLLLGPGLSAQVVPDGDASHLTVRFDEGLEGAAGRLEEAYPRLLARVEERLGIAYPRPLTVRLVRDHESFAAAVRDYGGGEVADHVAAIAFSFADVIVLKSEAWRTLRVESMEVVFQHEIVHCVLGHYVRENPEAVIPVWLNEGVAQWVSESPYRPEDGVLAAALAKDALIPFSELDASFPAGESASALAYAQALSFVRFLSRLDAENEFVRGNIRALIRHLGRGRTIEDALLELTGRSFEQLQEAWRGEASRELDLGLRRLPEFLFAGFIGVVTLLLWATIRGRRRRALEAMDRSPDAPFADLAEETEALD